MSEEPPNVISDTQPSPWVCCPSCGEIWLRITAVLERGRWVEGPDGKERYTITFDEPPLVGGYRSAAPEITCATCGLDFGLTDVGYQVKDLADG